LQKRQYVRLFWNFVTGVFLILSLFPIIWTILSSFKPPADLLTMPPKWIFLPSLCNYVSAFKRTNLLYLFLNSIITAIASSIVVVLVGALAGYALTRFKFFASEQLAFFLLFTRMFPPIVIALALFFIMKTLRLIDTRLGLIFAHTSYMLAFGAWLMRAFFIGIPTELDEAAMIDGCSRLGAFIRIVLPTALPSVAAIFIFSFVTSWNEFFFALVLTRHKAATLPLGISSFVTEYEITWGAITASATFVMLPVLVIGIIAQKFLISGFTAGSVKG